MKTHNIAILGAGILLAFALWFFTSSQFHSPEGPSDARIAIGALLPMTGPAATTGDQLNKAITLAIEDHEAKSGIKARYVLEDSRNDPAAGVAGFRKLATLDKVNHVIVSLSGVSQAVTPIANAERMSSFALASAPIPYVPNDYMVRWFIDGAGEARAMAQFAQSQGYKRIAVVHINDDYGRVLLEVFKEQLKEAGVEPVYVEGFDRKTEDFRSLAFKAKSSTPDAVYFIAYGRPLGIALRQFRESGLEVPFLSTFGFEIAGTRELAGPASESLVYTSIPFGQGADESPATKAFVEKFRRVYAMEPSSDAALAYDLTSTLLSKGEMPDPPRKAVGQVFSTQFGELKLSEKMEVLAPVILKQITNDQVVQVKP